jgi:hypothetical protein
MCVINRSECVRLRELLQNKNFHSSFFRKLTSCYGFHSCVMLNCSCMFISQILVFNGIIGESQFAGSQRVLQRATT